MLYAKTFSALLLLLLLAGCSKKEAVSNPPAVPEPPVVPPKPRNPDFIFGADLSYTNQLLGLNALYKNNGVVADPCAILKAHGNNLVRLRLWHTPLWTKEVYGTAGKNTYCDLADVERAIKLAKANQQKILLDFHYSDKWADPATQEPPAAWKGIRDIAVLRDSVYLYTFRVLAYLDAKGLMPELVQTGNEINCGMLYSNTANGFPDCNACNGQWQNLGSVINSAIRAVRDVSAASVVKTKVVLHVADPKNVDWWFGNIKTQGNVSDFDIVGFSYYPAWHTTIGLPQLSATVAAVRTTFNKPVMVLETAYPWTGLANDNYTNLFGESSAVAGYPLTVQSQYDLMKAMAQAVITGGGSGIIYWAPDWISVKGMKDLWGEGSPWENCAFFDFSGNAVKAVDYPMADYKW